MERERRNSGSAIPAGRDVTGQHGEYDAEGVDHRDSGLDVLAEAKRRRFHPDQCVVLTVLNGVDRVVAERPEDQRAIEQGVCLRDLSLCRRRCDERSPVESEAEPDLRPPGDPLHQRIERDHGNSAERHQLGQIRQAEQHREPDATLREQPYPRPLQRYGPGRERTKRCARHFRVDVAIQNIVIGTARAAHCDRADYEQSSQPSVAGLKVSRRADQGHADEAGQAEQPEARRTVVTGKLQVRPGESRRAHHPGAAHGVGRGCGGGGLCHDLSLRGSDSPI